MTINLKLLSTIIYFILSFIYSYVVIKTCKNKNFRDNNTNNIDAILFEFIISIPISVIYIILSEFYLNCIKHVNYGIAINFDISGKAVLIIGIISLTITLLVFSNFKIKIKDIISAMSMKDALLKIIHKDRFIYKNNYVDSPIDGIMIEDPIAIKKLTIINKDLIPKLNKLEKLINKLKEAEDHNSDIYKEQYKRLRHNINVVNNKIGVLCDEIIEIENKNKDENKINHISEEIDKIEKTL